MASRFSYKKWLRRLLLSLAILLSLILSAIYWLAGTNSGTGWLLGQAQQHVAGLQSGRHQGSLLYGLQLSDLSYQQTGLHISANSIELNISARALLLPHIVIQQLKTSGLRIAIESTDSAVQTQTSAASQAPTAIALPDWLPTSRIQQLTMLDSQLTLSGLDIALNSLNLQAELKNQLVTLNGLHVKGLQLTLDDEKPAQQASGPWPLESLPDMPAPVNMRLKDIQLEDLKVIQGGQPIDVQHAMLQMQWLGKEFAIDRLEVQSKQLGSLDLRGQAVLKTPYQLNVEAKVLAGADILPHPLAEKPFDIHLSGPMNQLLLQLSEPAQLALMLRAHADITRNTLPFSASMEVNTAPLAPLLALPEQAALSPGMLNITAQGDLNSQQAELDFVFKGLGFGSTQPATLHLTAQHSPGHLNKLQLEFNDDSSASAMLLNGALNYEQTLQWQMNGQISHLQLDSPLLPIVGAIQGQFQHQGQWSDKGWGMQLHDTQLSGNLNDMPLRVSASADVSQAEQLQVSHLDLRMEAFNSTLKITGLADQSWQLQGKLYSDDLSALPINAQGQVEADIQVSGELTHPRLKLDGNIKQLHMDSLSLQDLRIQADYQPLAQHATELSVSFPSVVLNNEQHFHGHLTLSGNETSHQLQMSLAGDLTAELLMHGSADLAQQNWHGKLLQADSQIFNEHWQLSKPVELQLADGQFGLSAHCWNGKFSHLCLKQPLTFPGQQAVILGAEVDYGRWSEGKLTAQQLSGTATLDANIQFPQQGPMQLQVSLNSSAGHLQQQWEGEQLPLLTWQGGQFNLHSLDDGSLQLEGQLLAPSGQDLLKLDGKVGNKADADLSANLHLAPLPLAGFINLVPQLSKLDGQLSANIQVDGKLNAPRVSGEVQLQDTAIVVAGTQTAVDKLDLLARFDETRLNFDGRFTMGTGEARLSGSTDWDHTQKDWQKALSMQARLEGQGLQLQALPELQASISPNLDIRFEQGLQLNGQVNVDSGRFTLQELPASAVNVSEDMRLVNQVDTQQKSPLPINLQLDIELVDPFAISGFGFNGKIDGSLTARQKSPEPLEVFGALTFTEGVYKAYGQNLEVKSGRLQFLGQANNPTVQLQAIRPLKGTGVEAGIEVTGPVNGLQVALFSNPTMEQSAILSYILRGKPPGTSGESDGRSMALLMAANQGIGITGASGLTDALNDIPLVSDITLDTETDAASGDSLATVSGYIGERIYLKYGVGILEPVTQITVRFYLLNQLWLEAVSSLERSMDLYYSFDIE